MKTFINMNKRKVYFINIPFMINNELQLFMERFSQMQSISPQLSPKFEIEEYNDEKYFHISIWHRGAECYFTDRELKPIMEYIRANQPIETV